MPALVLQVTAGSDQPGRSTADLVEAARQVFVGRTLAEHIDRS